jgi:hypothetical protein
LIQEVAMMTALTHHALEDRLVVVLAVASLAREACYIVNTILASNVSRQARLSP